jgi:hypothetical protein
MVLQTAALAFGGYNLARLITSSYRRSMMVQIGLLAGSITIQQEEH